MSVSSTKLISHQLAVITGILVLSGTLQYCPRVLINDWYLTITLRYSFALKAAYARVVLYN